MKKLKFEFYLNLIYLNLHRSHVTSIYYTSILLSSEFKISSSKNF